ncbi:MAG TPA: hypothetical protein VFU36_03040 [Jatrophihabitans sp.]|nr:hypothetical protein [Jatrophihabitans sp.]
MPATSVSRGRLLIGAIGTAMLGYGVVRIFTDAKDTKPVALAKWLLAALLVHDVLIAPAVLGVGWLLVRFVPPRARRYLQAGLICGGLVSALGVLLIWRQGKVGAASLALLQQDYRRNLLILLALVAAGCLAGYLAELFRLSERLRWPNWRKTRPPADQ